MRLSTIASAFLVLLLVQFLENQCTNSGQGIKRDLITATAAIAGLSSILFGFLTNMPVAFA